MSKNQSRIEQTEQQDKEPRLPMQRVPPSARPDDYGKRAAKEV